MAPDSDSDSDSDSLGSFGAELEAELLRQQEPPPSWGEEGSAKRRKLSQGSPHEEAPPDTALPPPVEEATTQQLCPPHPGFLGGICIRCGALRRRDSEEGDGEEGGQQHVSLSYLSAGLEVRAEVVSQLRSDELRRVLAQRKLLLILDLDHTLLNSARSTDLDAPTAAALHALHDAQAAAGGEAPELYNLAAVRLWTKLRPGARALIHDMASLCEVLVYTMGDRSYAGHMAQLLDPGGRLLRPGRLISAGDSTVAGVKDLDVVLGDSRGVVVVDDTRGVWRSHGANVIVPERYHFFPSSALGFGDRGETSWLAKASDEDPATGQLASICRVITAVHASFFDAEARQPGSGDVRTCLATLRRGILAGCVLLFSGVIPVSSSVPQTEHVAWRSALELGAEVVTEAGGTVTHVIAQRSGTDKHRWAVSAPGVACVTPAWLAACASQWVRVPEEAFAVTPP